MIKSTKALAKVLFSAVAALMMIDLVARASQLPSVQSVHSPFEKINSLLSDQREVISSVGRICYIGGKFSVVTRELPVIEHLENPISHKRFSELAIDSGNSTDFFYEQTQLKACLI